jgi:glycosyltransferase involved in cell wall biosynthesis
MKLAVVVQRYGADINGGAELHARYVAERLAAYGDVRVLTTCAKDYVTWRNELPPGEERVNGIPVERFAVSRERDTIDFGRRSSFVFERTHSLADELAWLESEGPVSPGLLARLRRAGSEFDFVLLFSVRYHHAYHGARTMPNRAVLVPTAEREASLGLALFQPVFRGVRAIMYNSPEERALIQQLSANTHVPGVVVGVGSEVPSHVDPERARQRFRLHRPFLVYVGRIDANKGCAELFDYFIKYVQKESPAGAGRHERVAGTREPLDLVLIGREVLPVPSHPRIRHLGFVSDQDKFDVIAAAEALVMPSYFESLSMVALEAWALGRPVIANARCDVLVGQARRSNAGLYYANAREFAAIVDTLRQEQGLAARLGANGRTYFDTHYSWPVIERKYLDMLEQLQTDPPRHDMEPLPGWWARHQRTLRPAAAIVDASPRGPSLRETP